MRNAIPRYIRLAYAFGWLDNLQEKWTRKLIDSFITPYITQKIVMPFGTDSIMVKPPNSHCDCLGCSVSVMDALYYEDGSFQGDGSTKQEKIPCQNAGCLGRKIHGVRNELFKPPINGEFNDFSEATEDCTIHVRGVDSEWRTNERNRDLQRVNSRIESENNTSNHMVHFECQERIRELKTTLGPLLRIDTLESSSWSEDSSWTEENSSWTKEIPKTLCGLVLPSSVYEARKNKTDPSVRKVSRSDEIDETHGCCRSPLMVVDIIMKSYRNDIATSLGLKLQDQDQDHDDDIGYVKEDLVGYLEEIRNYGFDHVIVIGERYCGLLFMDCFGRVFDLDSMGNILWFLGDYSERAERVTKRLRTGRGVPWIVELGRTVIELKDDTPYGQYNFLLKKKSSKKKGKHHH